MKITGNNNWSDEKLNQYSINVVIDTSHQIDGYHGSGPIATVMAGILNSDKTAELERWSSIHSQDSALSIRNGNRTLFETWSDAKNIDRLEKKLNSLIS